MRTTSSKLSSCLGQDQLQVFVDLTRLRQKVANTDNGVAWPAGSDGEDENERSIRRCGNCLREAANGDVIAGGVDYFSWHGILLRCNRW